MARGAADVHTIGSNLFLSNPTPYFAHQIVHMAMISVKNIGLSGSQQRIACDHNRIALSPPSVCGAGLFQTASEAALARKSRYGQSPRRGLPTLPILHRNGVGVALYLQRGLDPAAEARLPALRCCRSVLKVGCWRRYKFDGLGQKVAGRNSGHSNARPPWPMVTLMAGANSPHEICPSVLSRSTAHLFECNCPLACIAAHPSPLASI